MVMRKITAIWCTSARMHDKEVLPWCPKIWKRTCSKFTPLRTTRRQKSTSLSRRAAHVDDKGKHDKPVPMEVDALLAKVTALKLGRGKKDEASDGESHHYDAWRGRPQHQEEETWSDHSSVTLDQIVKELMARRILEQHRRRKRTKRSMIPPQWSMVQQRPLERWQCSWGSQGRSLESCC